MAFGPNAGKKALTLQAVPESDDQKKTSELVSMQVGFSLHAGVACKSNQREKIERLCRYITHQAITEQRLSLASSYTLEANRSQLKNFTKSKLDRILKDPVQRIRLAKEPKLPYSVV